MQQCLVTIAYTFDQLYLNDLSKVGILGLATTLVVHIATWIAHDSGTANLVVKRVMGMPMGPNFNLRMIQNKITKIGTISTVHECVISIFWMRTQP